MMAMITQTTREMKIVVQIGLVRLYEESYTE